MILVQSLQTRTFQDVVYAERPCGKCRRVTTHRVRMSKDGSEGRMKCEVCHGLVGFRVSKREGS